MMRKTMGPRSARCMRAGYLVVLAIVLGVGNRPLVAQAAQFTVTSSSDAVDINPGDGLCQTTNGTCTLRAAVQEANATPGADTIRVPAGIYTLTISGTDELAAQGDLDLTGDLSIRGVGLQETIIDAHQIDRAIDVMNGVQATLRGVTIRNGNAQTGAGGNIRSDGKLLVRDSQIRTGWSEASGGGIASTGELTLMRTEILSNTATTGGGLAIIGKATIVDTQIQDNFAQSGGGIMVDGVLDMARSTLHFNGLRLPGSGRAASAGGMMIAPGSTVTLRHTTISANIAINTGGIDNAGTLVLAHSSIRENDSIWTGGGIFNQGTLQIHQTQIVSNSSLFKTGGIANTGTLTVTQSLIHGNTGGGTSTNYGQINGGIVNDEQGRILLQHTTISSNTGQDVGGIDNAGVLIVERSTISQNRGPGVYYRVKRPGNGGIRNTGTLILIESMLSNNTGSHGGGLSNSGHASIRSTAITSNTANLFYDVFGEGGGIANAGVLQVINSTLSGNTAVAGGALYNTGQIALTNATIAQNSASDGGGGIATTPPDQVALGNTIIADNADASHQAPDCDGTLDSRGHNLIEVTQGCTIAGTLEGNIIGQDPKLRPLGLYGGPTPIHALSQTSPAVDAGDNSLCPATDQRGRPRPQGRRCDIGAYEASAVPRPFPATGLLDRFDRRPGPLGPGWFGPEGLGGYQIIDQQLDVVGGGPIYWHARQFGSVQEVFVRLLDVATDGREQNLLLKVQGNVPDWRNGAIEILYDAHAHEVRVETYVPSDGWVVQTRIPTILQDGDQFGGRAYPDGSVEVYRNGEHIGTAQAGSFFAGRGGWIGLWWIDAGSAWIDDFGGGSLPSAPR